MNSKLLKDITTLLLNFYLFSQSRTGATIIQKLPRAGIQIYYDTSLRCLMDHINLNSILSYINLN